MSDITPNLFFNLKGEYIHMQFLGDGNIIYKSKKNIFKEQEGLIIENPQPDFPVYYITLSDFGDSLLCGNIVDTVYAALLAQDIDNVILVLDFDGIIEVNESFCEQYIKYLLTTKNKVITIKQNRQVNEVFSKYVIENITTQFDEEEITEESEWEE